MNKRETDAFCIQGTQVQPGSHQYRLWMLGRQLLSASSARCIPTWTASSQSKRPLPYSFLTSFQKY